MNLLNNFFFLLLLVLALPLGQTAILDFQDDLGGIPNDPTAEVVRHNTLLLNHTLQFNASDATLIFASNQTFYFYHDIYVNGLVNSILQIDGTLALQRNFSEDPYEDHVDPGRRRPRAFLMLDESHNVTLTSASKKGLISGSGSQWWGIPFLGYIQLTEHRPTLFRSNLTTDLLIEHVSFKEAPCYNIVLSGVDRVEIHHVSIVARRTHMDGHSVVDLSAFNTDGIDVSGHNVWVHDVDIWNQDDCIAVKDNHHGNQISSNMTFERITASGLGFVIGSIGGSTVRNITFRDSYLYQSFKGIYLKFRVSDNPIWQGHHGHVEDILFENITIEEPIQWGVWIGPAQQADTANFCQGNPCSLCWPLIPLAQCDAVDKSTYMNITLKDITINNPKRSPGVIKGDDETKIMGIVFDNVLVTRGPRLYSDPRLLFPGLSLPIEDQSLDTGIMLLSAIVVLTLVAITSCCVGCRYSQKYYRRKRLQSWMLLDDAEIEESSIYSSSDLYEWYSRYLRLIGKCIPSGTRTTCALRQTMSTLLFSMLGFLCWWFVAILRMQEDVTDYFACQGVSGGIARGATWPVPSCFHDDTNFTSDLHKVSASTSLIQMLLFAVGGAFIWAASKAFRLFAVGRRNHREYSLAAQYEDDCEAEYSILEVDVHLSTSRDYDEKEDDIETTLRMNDNGGFLKSDEEDSFKL